MNLNRLKALWKYKRLMRKMEEVDWTEYDVLEGELVWSYLKEVGK